MAEAGVVAALLGTGHAEQPITTRVSLDADISASNDCSPEQPHECNLMREPKTEALTEATSEFLTHRNYEMIHTAASGYYVLG